MTKDIVFICDDNYCMPTAVCIQSIIDKIVDDIGVITIHVCTFGLMEKNILLLQGLSTSSVKVVVDTFDTAQYEDRINSIKQKSHVTPTALIKFEIANYFSELQSILYMDSDMVVKGDLSELLRLDIGDSYIGAAYEFWKHLIRMSYTLRRSVSKKFYFNSGVMILNLRKMREDNVADKLWYYKLNKAKTTLMDQESLNAVCASTAYQLPVKWNFNPYFLKQIYINEINRVYKTDYKTLEQMEDDVCIIHYVGPTDKPWKYSTANMREYWVKAFNSTGIRVELDLKVAEKINLTRWESISCKIKTQGFYGFVCFVINKLLGRNTL